MAPLVIFALAVDVAVGSRVFSWASALGSFALSFLGGAAAGLLAAWLAVGARRALREPLLENTVSVLTPFAAFLLAEQVHASGVLAVVVCGLVLSQVGPRLVGAQTRLQALAFWQVTAFLLNATLFVLVGLQLRHAMTDLASESVAHAVRDTLLVAATVIGVRLVWYYTAPYVIRVLDRHPQQRLRRVGARHRFPSAWAGFRGGVSLAAALAVPVAVEDRDLVIVITFGVILATLLVQGLTLPAVLRWAQLPQDDAEAQEQRLAEITATQAGLAALPAVAAGLAVSESIERRVRAEYEERLHALDDHTDGDLADHDVDAERGERTAHKRLHAALLADKRAAVVRLRDARRIDDIVLRRVQARLDAEEVRLAALVDDS
jgi:Na+/H+ antiporter